MPPQKVAQIRTGKQKSDITTAKAAKLRNLFTRHFDRTIGEGADQITLRFRALTQTETEQVSDHLMQGRERLSMEMAKRREEIATAYKAAKREDLARVIRSIEEPFAVQAADLAPNQAGDTSPTKEEREAEAVATWWEKREGELETLTDAEMHDLAVDRQFTLIVGARAANEATDLALTLMCIDPETGEPFFTNDPESPDYVGNLMPETKRTLNAYRMEFVNMGAEQVVRKTVTAGPSLPSGELPGAAGGYPWGNRLDPVRLPSHVAACYAKRRWLDESEEAVHLYGKFLKITRLERFVELLYADWLRLAQKKQEQAQKKDKGEREPFEGFGKKTGRLEEAWSQFTAYVCYLAGDEIEPDEDEIEE